MLDSRAPPDSIDSMNSDPHLDASRRRSDVSRPAFLVLCGALLQACGSGSQEDGAGSQEDRGAATTAAPEQVDDLPPPPERDDWLARHTRSRRPQFAAHLEATARAVQEDPDDGGARCELGWALFQNGQVEEAEAQLRRAVALAPQEVENHRRLGLVLYGGGKHLESVEYLERAVGLAPGDSETHFFLGHANERLGRGGAALEQFRLAEAANPDHAESVYQQGLLLLDEDPSQATRLFERALTMDAYHPGACVNLARLYRKSGRGADAQDMLRRHREIALLSDLGVAEDPKGLKRYLAEAGYYARQQKALQALEVVANGLEQHPMEAPLWLMRGRLLTEGDDVDGARVAFEKACDLAPDDPGPPGELAQLYLDAKEMAVPVTVDERLRAAARRWPQMTQVLEQLEAR